MSVNSCIILYNLTFWNVPLLTFTSNMTGFTHIERKPTETQRTTLYRFADLKSISDHTDLEVRGRQQKNTTLGSSTVGQDSNLRQHFAQAGRNSTNDHLKNITCHNVILSNILSLSFVWIFCLQTDLSFWLSFLVFKSIRDLWWTF